MQTYGLQSKHCNNNATTLQQHCNSTATVLHLMTSTAKIGNVDASVMIPKQTLQQHCNNIATALQQYCTSRLQ